MTDTTDHGSPWISDFLAPGDNFGRKKLTAKQHGVILGEEMTIVDTREGLAALGHALVEKFGTPPTVYIAETETSRFTWHGIGRTPEEAQAALLEAWDQHCKEYGTDPEYLRQFNDEFPSFSGTFGTGFRDREQLPRP